MAVKKSTYRVDNGVGWDEHMLKTLAEQVFMKDGTNLEDGFRCLLGSNGYTKLPNGIIIQSGTLYSEFDGSIEYKNANFPIRFPRGIFLVIGVVQNINDHATTECAIATDQWRFEGFRQVLKPKYNGHTGIRTNYLAIGF